MEVACNGSDERRCIASSASRLVDMYREGMKGRKTSSADKYTNDLGVVLVVDD